MAENETNDVQEYDMSKDPARKAKSNDPGWKYGFWPDLTNKDMVQCSLCNRQLRSGVKRLKQHLVGNYGDVVKCPNATDEIRREIHLYINKRLMSLGRLSKSDYFEEDHQVEEEQFVGAARPQSSDGSSEGSTFPSLGTNSKRRRSHSALKLAEPLRVGKERKSIVAMVRNTPEEVVEERHGGDFVKKPIEASTKSNEEVEEEVYMHIANFFYENGIPLNAANARSFEVMIEAIGQNGRFIKPPTFDDLRGSLLDKAVNEANKLKEKHVQAWKEFGCTLMFDGWPNRSGRSLINVLVNSPKGTFFLESVDASRVTHDAGMLADLFEEKINEIGKEHVVQVVTDNGDFKAAGRLLEGRIPGLFWTPCVARCIDLMLEDIGNVKEFMACIKRARKVTAFIYQDEKVLSAMWKWTGGRDLVRPGAARFATSFLTLDSLKTQKDRLRQMFVSPDWTDNILSLTPEGIAVEKTILSKKFWNAVQDCVNASLPLLTVLRVVDGDERPAMPELSSAMNLAKQKITESFAGDKAKLLPKLMEIIENHWTDHMEVKLYGAALFLNPSKYFDLKNSDPGLARKQRWMFNDVLEKTIKDGGLVDRISEQADDYDKMRGSFGRKLAIRHQKQKSPLDWWDAYSADNEELRSLAVRIISLCCSFVGFEHNWNTFETIERRNALEHKMQNDLMYVQYNLKIAHRLEKRREAASDFDPLILEEFLWDNEWVVDSEDSVHEGDDRASTRVDEVMNALSPRTGDNLKKSGVGESSRPPINYNYKRKRRPAAASPKEEENLFLQVKGEENLTGSKR